MDGRKAIGIAASFFALLPAVPCNAEDLWVDAVQNVVVLEGKPAVKRTLDLTEPVRACARGLASQDAAGKPYAGVLLVVRKNCKAYVIPNGCCVTIDPVGSSSEVYLFFTDHGGTWDNGGAVRVGFDQPDVPDATVDGRANAIELDGEPIVTVPLDLGRAWTARAAGEAFYDLAEGRYENLLLIVDNDQAAYPVAIGAEAAMGIRPLGFSSEVHAFFVDALPPTDNRGGATLTLDVGHVLTVPREVLVNPGCERVVEVPVTMWNPEPVRAVSFGLTHEVAALELEGIERGTATADADFFQANTSATCPDGRVGGTVGIVPSTEPPLAPIPAGGPREVALFRYEVRSAGCTELRLADCLGEPPVQIAFDVAGTVVKPATIDGRVRVAPLFIRGDANEDGQVNIADPVKILYSLFVEEPLSCVRAADANDQDDRVDLADPVYLLNYLFVGGPPPPAPFPGCGEDPAGSTLPCESFPACCGGSP